MFCRSFRSSLLLAFLVLGGMASPGCTPGVGATCQRNVASDCPGLACCTDGQPRGTCQLSCPATPDAAIAEDAFSAEDAASAPDAFTAPPDADVDVDGGT